MKKVFLAILLFSVHSYAFRDLGVSPVSCNKAKQDARILADGHCMSLDTSASKIHYSSCRKHSRDYKVVIHYNCKLSNIAGDFDTYN
jgi:hypothetical protein